MTLREFLTALPRRLATGLALAAFGASPALADPQSFPQPQAPVLREIQIGRASCRERVSPYV